MMAHFRTILKADFQMVADRLLSNSGATLNSLKQIIYVFHFLTYTKYNIDIFGRNKEIFNALMPHYHHLLDLKIN